MTTTTLSAKYSKWDNLELSDDEDPHPGAKFIESQTLRRIKRESHNVKEQERATKLETLQKEQAEGDKAYGALESKAAALAAAGDAGGAEAARAALWAAQQALDARGAEIVRLERERKFNAEELCHVAKEKSLVGSAACKPDSVKEVSYEDFVALHKRTCDAYASRVRSYEENLAYLEEHPELLHEHCMGYLLMQALGLGMEGKAAAMRRVVRQKFHIKSLLEFAEAKRCPIRGVVRPFFTRLASEPSVAAEYDAAFESVLSALVNRAAEKVKERDAEEAAAAAAAAAGGGDDEAAAAQPLSREERLGPGGLDPVEVFESLPEALQKAYESKDVGALRAYVDGCEPGEARRLLRLMVDSGLWVPEPGGEGALLAPEDGAGAGGGAARG